MTTASSPHGRRRHLGRFGAGLPNVEVRELVYNPALQILAAGSHGRSVWEISTAPGGGGGGGGGGNLTGVIINGEIEGANQTSDTATNLGPLSIGTPINFINEDITRFPDGRNGTNGTALPPHKLELSRPRRRR